MIRKIQTQKKSLKIFFMKKSDYFFLSLLAAGCIAASWFQNFIGGVFLGIFLTLFVTVTIGKWQLMRIRKRIDERSKYL